MIVVVENCKIVTPTVRHWHQPLHLSTTRRSQMEYKSLSDSQRELQPPSQSRHEAVNNGRGVASLPSSSRYLAILPPRRFEQMFPCQTPGQLYLASLHHKMLILHRFEHSKFWYMYLPPLHKGIVQKAQTILHGPPNWLFLPFYPNISQPSYPAYPSDAEFHGHGHNSYSFVPPIQHLRMNPVMYGHFCTATWVAVRWDRWSQRTRWQFYRPGRADMDTSAYMARLRASARKCLYRIEIWNPHQTIWCRHFQHRLGTLLQHHRAVNCVVSLLLQKK